MWAWSGWPPRRRRGRRFGVVEAGAGRIGVGMSGCDFVGGAGGIRTRGEGQVCFGRDPFTGGCRVVVLQG